MILFSEDLLFQEIIRHDIPSIEMIQNNIRVGIDLKKSELEFCCCRCGVVSLCQLEQVLSIFMYKKHNQFWINLKELLIVYRWLRGSAAADSQTDNSLDKSRNIGREPSCQLIESTCRARS
jgi:hypothetical protein